MRRKSAIDIAKRQDRIERARRMKPEDRLLACVSMAPVALELQRAGKRYREAVLQKSRS